MYANIIVDISHEKLDKTFQYAIPDAMIAKVEVGTSVIIPFGKGNRLIKGYVIELTNKAEYDPEKIKSISSVEESLVQVEGRLIKLAAWIRHNYGSTMNQALKTVIPIKESVKHLEKKAIRLDITKEEANELLLEFKRKNNVARARLFEALIEDEIIEYSLVINKLNISAQTIKALVNKGYIALDVQEYYRNPVKVKDDDSKAHQLNKEQRYITDSITNDYDKGIRKTYLIHGVTGSGKTEVYMELIEHVIEQGKQVIMLIPEISLTYQTVVRFYRRFKDKVSIMNSRLSKGERYDQFMRAKNNDISIMIGPRSALFTPFTNLGLIVIDEEHEGAYKSETSPRYHARETAIEIARQSGASVILGSATPSVDAYYNALRGNYSLFTLDERASKDSAMPTVYVEDLREELKNGNKSIFSHRLQKLIQDRLEKKEQIMLFLNKRGYAGFVSCRACGHVFTCPHCDISLTAHNNGKLICHYCGYQEPVRKICPKCGSKYVSGFRAGTQQVEEMVHRMYPDAKTLRMDMDTTSAKNSHEKILAAFAGNEADILIGTQMIVKGHDFPNVTLVGVLAADMSLYASDYRAAERTFELLTQAAGRAGRGSKPGEVVIQTYTPEHFSIQAASRQNYIDFYNEEIQYRSMLSYPPVSNMLMIRFMSKNEKLLRSILDRDAHMILDEEDENCQVIGPTPAGVYKINDVYSMLIYVKCCDYSRLTDIKDRLEAYTIDNQDYRYISIQYDFNPLHA